MHKMVDKEYIRKQYYMEGWSIRKISRQLLISRQTIRKMLLDAEIPKYKLIKERPSPVMGKYLLLVEQWLEEDLTAPKKQRHTIARIFERLQEEYDFPGSYSTVRRAVAKLKQESPEVFIPLSADPGEQVQVDFGHAKVKIAGVLRNVCLFCMRFKYSLIPFVMAFPTERLEAFLEGHVRAFIYFGGTPRIGLYDNAKTQVVKVLEGPEREEHEWFSSLRSHYLFESRFCRPRHGNEKGVVENLVKYVRSRALVPVPEFKSFDELNEHLLNWCNKEKKKHHSKWIIEQKELSPLPTRAFCAAQPISVKVNRYSLITVDRNRYSVPTKYVGQNLVAKMYVDSIEIISKDEVIACHTRVYGREHTSLKLDHYLTALARKPRAVTNATVVRELPEPFQRLRNRMEASHTTGYKDFLAVLLLTKKYTVEEINDAIVALDYQATAEILKLYLIEKRQSQASPAGYKSGFLKPIVTAKDTERYDQLFQEVDL